ncbi:MAG: cysteine desulfurase [Candidatus Marinimicrobia bacterium]|nr:cysteine desulfurase [Candidatus Neomarinimicrobiota bacterium]MBT5956611.1 cysteine desulfurase [Candidatus Neomarinimicrobiota bacterium]MBT6871553.1 cysteine desulfurase [Candidatus Neomarinimicrobiota bacterium]
MKKIYLDIAATTPVDPKVATLMSQVMTQTFGNPSSIHKFGQESHSVIERARLQLATALSCEPGEIIFTGGGSESNNLVLQGILNSGDHIITSAYEHPAILNVIEALQTKGVESTLVNPNKDGVIDCLDVINAIQPNTKLISIMAVNNELGTINPIAKLGEISVENNILFHTDAVQMFGKLPMDLSEIHINFMSMSAHKLYGPKGVGALYIRQGNKLPAILHGGGQENDLRPGTENIPGIAGFGLAAELATENLPTNIENILELEKRFLNALTENSIEFTRHCTSHIPGLMNISFHDVLSKPLLMNLDMEGVAISAGSACASGTLKASKVLLQMGVSEKLASESVRISLGKLHTKDDVDYAIQKIIELITRLKITAEINA